MEWHKISKNKNGGFDIIEWSPNDEVQLQFASLAIKLGALIAINAIVSAYCLFWYSVSNPKHRYQQAVAGILGSVIWILDYMFGGISWMVLHNYPETYVTLTAINIIILVLHIFTVMFDEFLFSLFNRKDGWLISLAVFGGIIYFLLPMFSKFVELTIKLSEISLVSLL